MKVNWDDDIPNIWENKKWQPNHQPVKLYCGRPVFTQSWSKTLWGWLPPSGRGIVIEKAPSTAMREPRAVGNIFARHLWCKKHPVKCRRFSLEVSHKNSTKESEKLGWCCQPPKDMNVNWMSIFWSSCATEPEVEALRDSPRFGSPKEGEAPSWSPSELCDL